MKTVNIMNFVRQIDEREENSTARLLDLTTEQLKLVNEYGVKNTFLLQYDTMCDDNFVSLFKRNATDATELGLWYELAEPLTTACGIEYRSENGWKWDWHIIPGFSMAYTPTQRELLIDEAMRKFKEVFGYYPKTVASWVIDTHTLNHLAENYDVKAMAICRDQASTDAYTLLGGYFNQAYYPSKNNIFTPAQTPEAQVGIPMFRLLGPCPIHNYDYNKYGSDELRAAGNKYGAFTLESCWYMGSTPETAKWLLDTFYSEESLGFAYSQIGQENSFFKKKARVLSGTRMQIEYLIARGDVEFQTMSETGEAFMKAFPEETPATSVVALNNWDTTDIQSVYYDCKNYTANLFRFEDKIFFRSLFLFDERIKDAYIEETCTTFDAVYENLPIVDSMNSAYEDRKQCGLLIDESGAPFSTEKIADGVLRVSFGDKSVTFYDDRMEIVSDKLLLYGNSINASVSPDATGLMLIYKGHEYRLDTEGAEISVCGENIKLTAVGSKMVLRPQKV